VFALDVLVCARCAGPRRIHATLRVLLNAALDDRIILANPADKLARPLYLVRTVAARQEEIKALSREQLGAFLAAAARVTPRVAPLFVLLARTGMRLGEALISTSPPARSGWPGR
jgi:integrase